MVNHSKFYFITNITSAFLALFTLPIFTRLLSPEDFGILALFILFGSISTQIISLSLDEATKKFFFDDLDFKLLNSTNLIFILFIFLICGIFIFVFSSHISTFLFKGEISSLLVVVSYISGCLTYFFSYLNGLFIIKEKSYNYLIVNLLFTFFNPILAVIIILNSDLSYEARIISMISITLISISLSFYLNRDLFVQRFSKDNLKKSIIFSYPLVPSQVISQLNEITDRYMTNYYLGLNSLGIFSIAIRISEISKLFINSFLQSWTPFFLKNSNSGNKKRIVSGYFTIISVITLSVYGISIFSEEIVKFLTVKEFYFTIKYIPLICFSIFIVHIFTSLSANQIIYSEKTSSLVKITSITFLINIFLNILLIPKFQIYGAIIATTISGSISAIYSFFLGQKYFYIPIRYQTLLHVIIIYIIFNIPIYILMNLEINFILKIFIKVIIFLFLCLYLKKSKILRKNFINQLCNAYTIFKKKFIK